MEFATFKHANTKLDLKFLMDAQFWLTVVFGVLAPLFGAVAGYAAIRSDIAAIKATLVAQKDRIDAHDSDIGALRDHVHSMQGKL